MVRGACITNDAIVPHPYINSCLENNSRTFANASETMPNNRMSYQGCQVQENLKGQIWQLAV